MKAALLTKAKHIEIVDMEYPQCADNEIIIKVLFSGVCGSDLSTYRGEHPYKKAPAILGHEAAGIVDQIGKLVTNYKVGDKVCCQSFSACKVCYYCQKNMHNLCDNKKILNYKDLNGAFAEYIIGDDGLFFNITDNMNYKEGALVEPLSVALHAIRNSGEIRNKNIAIIGTGTNGISCLICSKKLGVKAVLCSDISDSKGQRAIDYGCDYFVNVTKEDLQKKAKDFFPKGVDIVFISTSYPEVLNDAISISKKGAKIIISAYLDPDVKLDYNQIVRNELTMKGSALSNPEDIELIINWISEKKIKPLPMITNQFDLKECDKALKLFDKQTESVGKIIINCIAND